MPCAAFDHSGDERLRVDGAGRVVDVLTMIALVEELTARRSSSPAEATVLG
jgi:hypothetical protein